MAVLRKNKVLDTEIVRKCFELETLTYVLIDKWKKTYRYSLIENFRKHVERLRECVINALRTGKDMQNEKLMFYDLSLTSLDNIEYLLEMMVGNNFNIISNKQYADFAMLVDNIGEMADRLMRSLKRKNNKDIQEMPEFQSCDNGIGEES